MNLFYDPLQAYPIFQRTLRPGPDGRLHWLLDFRVQKDANDDKTTGQRIKQMLYAHHGRDKLFKVVQYSLRLYLWHMGINPQMGFVNGVEADNFTAAERNLMTITNTRRMFKVGRFIAEFARAFGTLARIAALVDMQRQYSRRTLVWLQLQMVLDVTARLIMCAKSVVDDIGWAARKGFLHSSVEERLQLIAGRLSIPVLGIDFFLNGVRLIQGVVDAADPERREEEAQRRARAAAAVTRRHSVLGSTTTTTAAAGDGYGGLSASVGSIVPPSDDADPTPPPAAGATAGDDVVVVSPVSRRVSVGGGRLLLSAGGGGNNMGRSRMSFGGSDHDSDSVRGATPAAAGDVLEDVDDDDGFGASSFESKKAAFSLLTTYEQLDRHQQRRMLRRRASSQQQLAINRASSGIFSSDAGSSLGELSGSPTDQQQRHGAGGGGNTADMLFAAQATPPPSSTPPPPLPVAAATGGATAGSGTPTPPAPDTGLVVHSVGSLLWHDSELRWATLHQIKLMLDLVVAVLLVMRVRGSAASASTALCGLVSGLISVARVWTRGR